MSTLPAVVSAGASRVDLSRLARDREGFLSSGEVLRPHLVSNVIHASWRRSQELPVDAENLTPSYLAQFDRETPLARNAAPVLLRLRDELANEPVGIILTDAKGAVLQRLCSDSGLTRALDGVRLVPGFSYAEEHVGTNGIGTALECRAPTLVNGAEHFTNDLGGFACAGVPIIHPINGALLGVLDLTSRSQHVNPLLLVVAKSTVRQLQERLFSLASASEIEVFTQYLRACKGGGESIIAFGEDLVMMNTHTQSHFDANDRAALLARSSDAQGALRPTTFLADLPSGITARIEYRPVFAGEMLAGGVLRIQGNPAAGRSVINTHASVQFPGVMGSSAIWQQACRSVLESHRRSEWLVLEGEPGVGKVALLRGVHQLRNPSGHFRVIDAADMSDPEAWLDTLAEELSTGGGTVVLRRVDVLEPQMIHEISAILMEASARFSAGEAPWVTMTTSANQRNAHVDTELLPHFPHSIVVPPLRHHLEDLRAIVQHLLGRITRKNTVSLSPAATNQLMRLPWQGNVDQLRRVLEQVAQQRRMGVINVDDLPAECRATGRRQLTKMGALERDAISASLAIHQGDKGRTAEHLGISRATIYRKLREYGITWTPDRATSEQVEAAGTRPV